MHTRSNLIAELEKIDRIVNGRAPDAIYRRLLVIDATTGQNGLAQAQEFTRATELTGVVLTKLDGTAKGGVALEIHRRLGVPIHYVGVGEKVEDLLAFDPAAYVQGLRGPLPMLKIFPTAGVDLGNFLDVLRAGAEDSLNEAAKTLLVDATKRKDSAFRSLDFADRPAIRRSLQKPQPANNTSLMR